MIQITPHMRILLAVEAVDFRKGIDGLAALCRQVLERDPLDGTLFVFCGRSRRAIKCLVYDGQGFWLFQKRLSQGRFAAWPMAEPAASRGVDPHQLHALCVPSARLPKGLSPNKKTAGVTFDPDVMDFLRRLCEERQRDRSYVINAIIRDHAVLWQEKPMKRERVIHF